MAKTNEKPVEQAAVNPEELNEKANEQMDNNEELNEDDVKTFDSVVRTISAKKGNKLFKGLSVKTISYDRDRSEYSVCITLRNYIPGYVVATDENGERYYKLGKTNQIWTTVFAIAAVIKECTKYAWVGKKMTDDPESINGILSILCSDATIDIVRQPVEEGEEYVNPFSRNGEPTSFDHDTIMTHLVNFKFDTEEAVPIIRQMAMNMLKF